MTERAPIQDAEGALEAGRLPDNSWSSAPTKEESGGQSCGGLQSTSKTQHSTINQNVWTPEEIIVGTENHWKAIRYGKKYQNFLGIFMQMSKPHIIQWGLYPYNLYTG